MQTVLRALLVEDSEDDAVLLELELGRSGHRTVIERVDTAEAMVAALDRQAWDLVIADYRMPKFSALGVLVLLKERGLDVPVIIVSGAVGEETAVEAMRAGAHDFVVKGNWARLGPAIEREILEAANRRERRWADHALHVLADASKELAGPLDVDAPLRNVVRLIVPFLADACVVNLVSDSGKIHRQIVTASNPATESLFLELERRYPIDLSSPVPVAQVVREGASVFIPDVTESFTTANASDPDHAELVRKLGVRSFLAVPLIARERTLGAIGLSMIESGRRFGRNDRELAEEVAGRCAMALDSAWHYREAREQATIQARLNTALREAVEEREEALRRESAARAEAEAAVRTRDEFLSVAAHELRTPIASLHGIAQLEIRRIDRSGIVEPDGAERAIRLIDAQAMKLTRLIGQLLDVSRIEAGKLRLDRTKTDLVSLVQDVVDVARARTDDHRVEVEATADVRVLADPIRLEQVLVNLIDNAIKYSPEGGPIEIEVSAASPSEAWISITDHGIGVPMEHRERIFDRFYQAGGPTHIAGLGLGLYVSRQIVELHGGHLVAEFPPAGGTRFIVQLPIGES